MLVGHAVGGETALKHLVYVQRIQRVGVAVPLQGTLHDPGIFDAQDFHGPLPP